MAWLGELSVFCWGVAGRLLSRSLNCACAVLWLCATLSPGGGGGRGPP